MAFDPDAYIAEKTKNQPFDPDAYLASKQVQPAQPAQSSTKLPGEQGYDEWMNSEVSNYQGQTTFGQKLMTNLLDNPLGEALIRMSAPSEEEATRALDFIKRSSNESRKGTAEAALTVGSGIVAEPVSGLAGLATTPMGAEEATQAIEGVRNAMTYTPQTESGQNILQGMGETMQPVANAFKAVEETTGDVGYDIGGPLLGAAGETLPTAILTMLGFNQARKATGATKLQLEIADKLKSASAQPELGKSIKTIAEQTASGKANPRNLPAIIKSMEDDIVHKSGKSTYKRLSELAEKAKAGDAEAVKKMSEVADEIAAVQADKSVAKYIADGAEKIKTDPVAKEAIKQGFEPGVVTAVKGSTPADRAKMLKMVEVMEKGKKDAIYGRKYRPADVAGDSLLDRVKYVRNVNQKAAGQLDTVAKSLRGKQVDFQQPIKAFVENLDEMGIRIDRNLQPIFKGSDIEGLSGPQMAVRNMIKRLTSGQRGKTPDAYELHRLKKYIDETVTYGKSGEGLKGKTERIMKQLRHDVDTALDDAFPEYNRVNTEYAGTRQALDALQDVAGTKMNLSGSNADKALGTLLRRLMSNAQSRINLVDSVDLLETTAKKYGGAFDDNITAQMMFADELDNVFGPVAKTSLAGEVEKAVKIGADVASGNKLGAAKDVTSAAINKIRGVNQDGAFKSIKDLLKDGS